MASLRLTFPFAGLIALLDENGGPVAGLTAFNTAATVDLELAPPTTVPSLRPSRCSLAASPARASRGGGVVPDTSPFIFWRQEDPHADGESPLGVSV